MGEGIDPDMESKPPLALSRQVRTVQLYLRGLRQPLPTAPRPPKKPKAAQTLPPSETSVIISSTQPEGETA